ncbi:MAG: DUF448 domain-containing protein [Candidatus Cloacimonetes bacterium]|nr:DUF448 domain-containing protein [Candidatus Cloacimonadota bacterium]
MPNQKSRAGHIPLRTCVVCRRKAQKNEFLRFILSRWGIVFDLDNLFPARGSYVCDSNECLLKLEKWKKKRKLRIWHG